MKKTIALLLSAALLLPLFAACGNKPAENSGDTADTSAVTEPVATEDIPDIPAAGDLNIGGDFNILVAGNWAWNDYESDGTEGTVVDSAIFRRNKYLLDNYGVDIKNEDIVEYSTAMGSGKGFMRLYTGYMSGSTEFDAAMIGTFDVATLAYSSVLEDLNEVPYIDLSKDYWDQKANEDLTISGRMFYTTGEISLSDNRSTNVMFFNKEMIQAYELDDPYELVRNNKWTFDKFAEMVKSVGEDLDQDGEYDQNDCFGLLSANDDKLAMLGAAREHIATIGADGNIVLTLYNERTVSIYDKYLALCGDYSHTFNWQFDYRTGKSGNVASNEERVAMMNTNRALFYPHMMFYIDYLRDIETNFGILPFPKFDESQAEYGHTVSAWHSEFLCVPRGVSDLSRTGIMLELLAYQGKKLLTPAYYEKTLVGQYTRDEESAEMLDIIFATRVFDVGIYYNLGGYKDKICSMLRLGDTLTNVYETNRSAAEQKLEGINELFRESTAD